MNGITLNIQALSSVTHEQFFQLCQDNRDLRLERTAEEELIIMPPTGWVSGNRNSKLTARLEFWAENDGTGLAFDSSTGYILPNGAERSPDASWVRRERIEALNLRPNQFLPLAPDFAIELRSAADTLLGVQQKMQEYMRCEIRLGWLIDPQNNRVEIYRQDREVEILENPDRLSGEDILLEFVLELRGILS